MLNKLGKVLLSKSKLNKIKFVFFITSLLSLIVFVSIPFWEENIYIVEKQMKVSDNHSNDITESEYLVVNSTLNNLINAKKDSITFKDNNIEIAEFLLLLFKSSIKLNKKLFKLNNNKNILSYKVISPRGDRKRTILLNFIVDDNKNTFFSDNNLSKKVINNLSLIFNFLNYFQDSKKTTWLAKDIIVSIIPYSLFYHSPLSILNAFNDFAFFNYGKKDFILNLDIDNINFSTTNNNSISNFIINYNGANSETVDMDYYKMIYDNLSSRFDKNCILSNYDDILFNNNLEKNKIDNKNIISSSMIKSVVENFGNSTNNLNEIKDILQRYLGFKLGGKFDYKANMSYFLKSLYSVFFMPYKLDANNLLVSKGINSITIKSKITNLNTSSFNSNIVYYIEFFKSLENIIKGLSIVEIEIFRGQYHYILTSNSTFVGVMAIIIIPILSVLRIVLEYFLKFYKRELYSKSTDYSKIVFYLLFTHTLFLLLFCEFDNILALYSKLIGISKINVNYLIILLVILAFNFIHLLLISLIKLNIKEFELFNSISSFISCVLCFCFFFVNYGVGLIWVVLNLSINFLSIFTIDYYNITDFNIKKYRHENKLNKLLNNLKKYCLYFLSLALLVLVFFSMYFLIFIIDTEKLMYNFKNYKNNVYPLLCCMIIGLLIKFNEIIVLFFKTFFEKSFKDLNIE